MSSLPEDFFPETAEVFIHLKKESYETKYTVHFFNADMSAYGYVFVKKQVLKLPVFDFQDVIRSHIKSLQMKLQKERADFQIQCQKREEEIANLRTLTYKPESPSNE